MVVETVGTAMACRLAHVSERQARYWISAGALLKLDSGQTDVGSGFRLDFSYADVRALWLLGRLSVCGVIGSEVPLDEIADVVVQARSATSVFAQLVFGATLVRVDMSKAPSKQTWSQAIAAAERGE